MAQDLSTLSVGTRGSATTEPLTFHWFRRLPNEIRNMIWTYALPGPRIVDIIYNKEQDRYFSFNCRPPALLHACTESRHIASKSFKLCFATETHAASIYFQFDTDTLYFCDWLAGHKSENKGWFEHVAIGPLGKKGYGREEQYAIQHVAVNSHFLDIPHSPHNSSLFYFYRSILPLLQRMSALKSLCIVTEDIDPYQRGEVMLFTNLPGLHHHAGGVGRGVGCNTCVQNIKSYMSSMKDLESCEWKVPYFQFAGAVRGTEYSHLGPYQPCPCNGISLPPEWLDHPCNEFITEVTKAEEKQEANARTKIRVRDSEIAHLIRDEKEYINFIEHHCDGKYGSHSEEWFGSQYLLERDSL